ncbi:MAG: IS110 family transposase [Candidatus Gastranaerophilaceae bacterium]|jgi:transposase
MIKTLYAGIDVSKDKLDIAITQDGKEIIATATFENTFAGNKKLFSWCKKHSKGFLNIHFCLEATGIYHEEIAECLQEQGKTIVSVINPFQSKSFAKARLLRTKNDKVDAALLAFYCAISRPEETVKTSNEVKKLRKLVRCLNVLIKERAREKTRLHSTKDTDVADVLKGTIKFHSQSIAQIEQKIKEHVKNFPKLNEQVKLLKSIKGVGDRTAWQLLAELHIEDGKTLNSKAQVAHAGLAPREFQSGSSVHGKPRICKTGNHRLRKALYMPALSTIRYNKQLSEFYQRLLSKGKLKMVALVAVMRKMLVMSIAILNSGKPYDENWANKYQKTFALAS